MTFLHIGQLNLGMKGDDKSQRAAGTSKMSIKAHQSSRNSNVGRISVLLMQVKRGDALLGKPDEPWFKPFLILSFKIACMQLQASLYKLAKFRHFSSLFGTFGCLDQWRGI